MNMKRILLWWTASLPSPSSPPHARSAADISWSCEQRSGRCSVKDDQPATTTRLVLNVPLVPFYKMSHFIVPRGDGSHAGGGGGGGHKISEKYSFIICGMYFLNFEASDSFWFKKQVKRKREKHLRNLSILVNHWRKDSRWKPRRNFCLQLCCSHWFPHRLYLHSGGTSSSVVLVSHRL